MDADPARLRRVLPTTARVAGEPWSGCQPEECVQQLARFLRCALGAAGYADPACAAWYREVSADRFLWPAGTVLPDDARELFEEVLLALYAEGGGETISRARLGAFYARALPPAAALPHILTVRGAPASWFVPEPDGRTYVSCVRHSRALHDAVLALDVLAPLALAAPGARAPADGAGYGRLPEMMRIMRYFRSRVRPEGLRRDERDAFLEATLRILDQEKT